MYDIYPVYFGQTSWEISMYIDQTPQSAAFEQSTVLAIYQII